MHHGTRSEPTRGVTMPRDTRSSRVRRANLGSARRCGRVLDSCGHHRAACSRVGVLGVQDLDLAPGANTTDGRRLEVVADGLSLFQGAQLAIDTTLVSARRADGTPRHRAATTPGAVLDDARTRKETIYPELVGEGCLAHAGRPRGRSRRTLVSASRARSAPEIMQASVAHAWRHRWRRILACATAKAFASSLLEHRFPVSAAGDIRLCTM